MRAIPAVACAAAILFSSPVLADAPPAIKGLWLTSDFPSITLRAGEESSLNLNIYNYGLAPQRTDLSIGKKPGDWTATIEGQGKPVSAAFVDYDKSAFLTLKLKIPASAKPGAYDLVLDAVGPDARSELPIHVDLQPPLAARLTAEAKLPVLMGTPRSSFDYKVTVKNESAADMLANLTADAPKGFEVTFKEGYGSQELTSIPIKAGESKELSVSVKPSPDAAAGNYPVTVHVAGDKASVESRLTMQVSGQPSLALSGVDGRLSGSAYAGKERDIALVLRNTGTAPAKQIRLSASTPNDWKVRFEPKTVAELSPGAEAKVVAQLTPTARAINGDYVASFTAAGAGATDTASYRVTVLTSTLWGATGVGVIGAALLVLVGAVARFGRR